MLSTSGNADYQMCQWSTIQKESLGDGEISVQAETTEICLRTENAMGLYETRSGKAVVVRLNVGS